MTYTPLLYRQTKRTIRDKRHKAEKMGKTTTLSSLVSLYTKGFIDMVFPRKCTVCGSRLALSEYLVCTHCMYKMPRTFLAAHAHSNRMIDNIATAVPFQRCAALVWHTHLSPFSYLIYQLKYDDHPEIGLWMGRLIAEEMRDEGFFEGIDVIVPVPLTPSRQRWRGYNQSEEIAKGIAQVVPLPICSDALIRRSFQKSQTKNTRFERLENVKEAFSLVRPEAVSGRHVLIVDDIITTGATVASCASQLALAGDVTISVVAWGAAH